MTTFSVLSRKALSFSALCVVSLCCATHAHADGLTSGESVNLGSGFAVPIIDNEGQHGASVDFLAPGPTGNSVYFYDNGEIGLALRGYNDGDNCFTTISHVGAAGQLGFESVNELSSRTHYFGGGPTTLPTDILNYDAVALADVYSGVSATFSVNGRQLIATYTVAAGSGAEAITLGFENQTDIVFNEGNGNVEISLSGGRTILVHPGRITVGGGPETLQSFTVSNQNNAALAIEDLSETETSTVVVKITFGPYCHDYDAVTDGDGNLVAVSTAFNTMRNAQDDSDDDIIITRLNSNGDEVLSTTILAGNANDIAYGVAVATAEVHLGQIYVSGLSESNEFPIDGVSSEADAVIVRLSADAASVLSGAVLSGAGRDVAHDVAIGPNGEVLVVGASDGGLAELNTNEIDLTTVFPHVQSADKVQNYFVAVLNADANTVSNTLTFYGPEINLPILAGWTAAGDIQAGVEHITTSHNCNYTSQMAPWVPSPCRPDISPYYWEWGWHALCWKDAKEATHTLTLSNPPPSGSAPPNNDVVAVDATKLNQLEASHFSCGGCSNPDPAGVWQSNRYDNFTKAHNGMLLELALGAAYYHECCGSPVYANYVSPGGVQWDMPFMIRRVHLEVEDANGNPAGLLSVCGTQYNTSWTGDMFDFNCFNHAFGQIKFCSFDVIKWTPEIIPGGGPYNEDNWDHTKAGPWLSTTGVYIGDPPEDQQYIGDNIREIAHRLQRVVVAETDVAIVNYVSGEEYESSIESAHIRMMAFHEAGAGAAMPTDAREEEQEHRANSDFAVLSSSPNPATGLIQIAYTLQQAQDVRLELYNAMGRRVQLIESGFRRTHPYSVQFDTRDLAAGSYYLRLSSASGVISLPLNVVR